MSVNEINIEKFSKDITNNYKKIDNLIDKTPILDKSEV